MDYLSVRKGFLGARTYSAQFNYPLSTHEQWFWQVQTKFPKPKYNKIVNRSLREKISRQKYQYLTSLLPIILQNPFILAIFVTGSLSMNNCTKYDDIDLMFISKANTLWLCRFWNVLNLSWNNIRRPSLLKEHSSILVNNKICDNLYLESLLINEKNLYIAHEILQAKPVYDPYGLHRQFLLANSWVEKYLPIAYFETLKSTPKTKPIQTSGLLQSRILKVLNLIVFAVQYIYMRSKITSERISLTQAFFHPRKIVL